MTIAGKQINTEPWKLGALHLQRTVMIGGLLAFLFKFPNHSTAWALMGAAAADLFHAAKNGNGNGGGK